MRVPALSVSLDHRKYLILGRPRISEADLVIGGLVSNYQSYLYSKYYRNQYRHYKLRDWDLWRA